MATTTGVPYSFGVHEGIADAVGKTVADLRAAVGQPMNLPADAQAVINGQRVGNDHVIQKGEQVEFIKEAGVKG